MIALDTNALSLLFVPGATVCKRGTSTPIQYAKERIDELVSRLSKSGDKILVSTPTLSEFLVKVPPEKIYALVDELQRSANFKVQSFDTACAIELAHKTAEALAHPDGKRVGTDKNATWSKVNFDRQIVAVAIATGATSIISNDPDVVAIGKAWGFPVTQVEDLPLPSTHIPPPIYKMLEDAVDEPVPPAVAPPKQIEGAPTK